MRLVGSIALVLFIGSCGDKEPPRPPTTSNEPAPKENVTKQPEEKKPEEKPAPRGMGSFKIQVKYGGTYSEPHKIPTNGKDEKTCGKEIDDESMIVQMDSMGIKNVVVEVVKVSGGTKWSGGEMEIDNSKCYFVPHVRIVGKYTKVTFKNTDDVVHNVKVQSNKNESWNENIPPGKSLTKEYKSADEVKLACDVHPWMSGWLVVVANPIYAALTNEAGETAIENIPTGKYKIRLWHEKLGETTMEVEISADKTESKQFTWK